MHARVDELGVLVLGRRARGVGLEEVDIYVITIEDALLARVGYGLFLGLVKLTFWWFGSIFEAELQDLIPICHATIAGTRIIGRLTAGYVTAPGHWNLDSVVECG